MWRAKPRLCFQVERSLVTCLCVCMKTGYLKQVTQQLGVASGLGKDQLSVHFFASIESCCEDLCNFMRVGKGRSSGRSVALCKCSPCDGSRRLRFSDRLRRVHPGINLGRTLE